MTLQLDLLSSKPRRAPDPHSQKARVLVALCRDPAGVCVQTIAPDLAYTLRNRVSELRSEGVQIESARCTRHPHHAPVSRYWLPQ